MRLGTFAFSPRPVPTLAAVAAVALTVSLGLWQTRRAEEKLARQSLLEARAALPPLVLGGPVATADDLFLRRVRARGTYDAAGQVFVDNRQDGGRAGFHVVTPFAIEGAGATVLVNRGWVARTAAYPAPPAVPVPAGEQWIEGLASLPPARYLELGSAEGVAGNVWQNLTVERYVRHTGRAVLPVVVLATRGGDGLLPIRERPDAGVAKHQEYALTWFSLAATVTALWIGLNLKRTRHG